MVQPWFDHGTDGCFLHALGFKTPSTDNPISFDNNTLAEIASKIFSNSRPTQTEMTDKLPIKP